MNLGDSKEDLKRLLEEHRQKAIKDADQELASKIQAAADYFETTDPKVTCENYVIAKTNGNLSEASKCLGHLFEPLYCFLSNNTQRAAQLGLTSTINQVREELVTLINELKANHLKLRAGASATANPINRQTESINPSPMLSPRMKMAPDERSSNRDTMTKSSEIHMISSSRMMFYNQLFETLHMSSRKAILTHLIDNSESPLEGCRLIMLGLTLMRDEFKSFVGQLLETLLEIVDAPSKKQKTTMDDNSSLSTLNPRTQMMARYARNLLILDAIPLVMDSIDLNGCDIDIDQIFGQTLGLLSDHCLEGASNEHELTGLYEGVKKTIANKILGLDINQGHRDQLEEHVSTTLRQLLIRSIEASIEDNDCKDKLLTLVSIISDRPRGQEQKLGEMLDLIGNLNLQESSSQEKDEVSRHVPTPPPKTRGRPKKKPPTPAPSSQPNEEPTKIVTPSRAPKYVFYCLIEQMFTNYLNVLRNTKSRILVNFDNPMVAQLEQELAKNSSSQRSSRSKGGQQNATDSGPTQAKRVKMTESGNLYHFRGLGNQESPLNSAQSRKMDQQVISDLRQARRCYDFLVSKEIPSLSILWDNFKQTYEIEELEWFKRFQVDSCIILEQHKEASQLLESYLSIEEQPQATKKSNASPQAKKLLDTSSSVSTSDLRRLSQLISNYVQLGNKAQTLSTIEYVISLMKKCGLLVHDENYSTGNLVREYMITIDANLGFLFLDTISIIRFCLDILMDILERHIGSTNTATDTAIGHTIVLSQFDWPKEVRVYRKCIDWIRANKPKSTTPQYLSTSTKFTYPEFFHFVKNPNLIEDFMALLCQGYTLDIKDADANPPVAGSTQARSASNQTTTSPGKTTTRGAKAITTRGVNKTFREDLKVAMISQMKCSSVLISLDMISEFIRCSVVPYLANGKK